MAVSVFSEAYNPFAGYRQRVYANVVRFARQIFTDKLRKNSANRESVVILKKSVVVSAAVTEAASLLVSSERRNDAERIRKYCHALPGAVVRLGYPVPARLE